MPKNRRKPRASGILTVLFLVGASLLLIVVANLLRGTPQRRVPQPQPAGHAAGAAAPGAAPEITGEERQDLERVLREKDAR